MLMMTIRYSYHHRPLIRFDKCQVSCPVIVIVWLSWSVWYFRFGKRGMGLIFSNTIYQDDLDVYDALLLDGESL